MEQRMPFVPVADLADIPEGRGLRICVEEVYIGLYHVNGQVFAMEDTCPHAGFPLSKGQLDGCVVICEAHGWPFDVRTGFDPENADGFPIPCFAVDVRGNTIHIDIGSRTNDPRQHSRKD
jgi:nitrite reductase/ring-hydroxylating ferredoxin subunit